MRHIISSQLILCKIWGFHGDDFEECYLVGYKNSSSYLTWDTLRLRYRAQAVNCIPDLRFLRRWLWRMPSSGMLHLWHAACFGCYILLTLFLARRSLSPWLWRRCVLPKRRFLQASHGVTSKKKANTTMLGLYFIWCILKAHCAWWHKIAWIVRGAGLDMFHVNACSVSHSGIRDSRTKRQLSVVPRLHPVCCCWVTCFCRVINSHVAF
jgi:hypothetical protein